MTPDGWKSIYRRRIGVGKKIRIRRYVKGNPALPHFDVTVNAKVAGYEARELIGGIIEGDRRVVFLAEDLFRENFQLPITTADKAIVDGEKELSIIAPDRSTREYEGVLIAFDLTVRG